MPNTIRCLRCVLLIYLTILLAFPVAIIMAGWFYHGLTTLVNNLQNETVFSYAISIVLIVCGFLTFANIILGCTGVCIRHLDLIITFAVILCLICISTLSVGIALLAHPDRLDIYRQRETFRNEARSRPIFWHSVQTMYNCCGIDGPMDWKPSVPVSCCLKDETSNNSDKICVNLGGGTLKTSGCFEIIKRFTYYSNQFVSICLICTVFMLFIGIGLSFAMGCAILRIIQLAEEQD